MLCFLWTFECSSTGVFSFWVSEHHLEEDLVSHRKQLLASACSVTNGNWGSVRAHFLNTLEYNIKGCGAHIMLNVEGWCIFLITYSHNHSQTDCSVELKKWLKLKSDLVFVGLNDQESLNTFNDHLELNNIMHWYFVLKLLILPCLFQIPKAVYSNVTIISTVLFKFMTNKMCFQQKIVYVHHS